MTKIECDHILVWQVSFKTQQKMTIAIIKMSIELIAKCRVGTQCYSLTGGLLPVADSDCMFHL